MSNNINEDNLTLAEFLNQSIGKMLLSRRLTGVTAAKVVTTLHDYILPGLGACRLKDLPTELPSFVAALVSEGLQPRAVRSVLYVLKRVMEVADPAGLVSATISMLSRASSDAEPLEAASNEAVEQLLAVATDNIEHFMFRLMTDTGMRAGEVAALQWSDFDLTKGTVTITRQRPAKDTVVNNGRSRTVPLSRRLVELATTLFADAMDARVFAGANIAGIRRRFLRLLYRAGSPFVGARRTLDLHDLRKAFGTRLRKTGVPVDLICKWMGISRHIANELGFGSPDASGEECVRTLEEEREILLAALESPMPDEQE